MNPVIVRNIEIGVGKPKICVPIIETTIDDIVKMAYRISHKSVDLIEWRLDWFEEVFEIDKVIYAARTLRKKVGDMPILCTFRTSNEGGEKAISPKEYQRLYEELILDQQIDMIDVELYMGKEIVRHLIGKAHEYDVKVILSNHDFEKTPSKECIVERLCEMQKLGGDIAKIAVMPQDEGDVLSLMNATFEMKKYHRDTPVIAMSMAGLGAITRIAGSLTGSAVTFGTVEKASAPGQIEVERLAGMLATLYE